MTWLCMCALEPAHTASLIAHTLAVHSLQRSLIALNTSVLMLAAYIQVDLWLGLCSRVITCSVYARVCIFGYFFNIVNEHNMTCK